MNVIVCKDSAHQVARARQWCNTAYQQSLAQREAFSMYVPAGGTPSHFYESCRQEPLALLADPATRLLQMDEVLDIPPERSFKGYLSTQLLPFSERLAYLDSAPPQFCSWGLFGLGLNGHVAFHEPGTPVSFRYGCLRLSDSTCENLKIPLGSWGLSYGLGSFMLCRGVLLLVKGSAKREILRALLSKERRLPASAFHRHPNATLLVSEDAWPK